MYTYWLQVFDSGRIIVDGLDWGSAPLSSVRKSIRVVAQEALLLDGSLLMNLLAFTADAPLAEANAAGRTDSTRCVTAPLDLVCKQAGVGRATLYRNFPDRHGLLLALLDRSINEMEDKARSLGEAPNAFFKLLRFQAERISARSSLVDYWRVIDREAPEIRRARQRMHALIKPHLERAVSAKLCRADLNDEDISLLTSMLGAALRGRTPDEQVGLGMRALDLIIEGLRPGTNRP